MASHDLYIIYSCAIEKPIITTFLTKPLPKFYVPVPSNAIP